MRLLYFLILTLCFCSCIQPPVHVKIARTNNICIADTCIEENRLLEFGEYITDYPIYYIGPVQDTIKIGNRYSRARTPWTNNFEYPTSRSYSDKNLNIYVDTSFKTNSRVEYVSQESRIIEDSTINYHSFLFTIKNISDTILYMGRTFSVFFIHREAKDRNGQWITIDRQLSNVGLCLTGEPSITLKPGEIIVSKIRRCEGSFLTEFRLVFGYRDNVVYSNTFKDYIDERALSEMVVR
ncbi:MAG TPA: hypothetical protein VIM79_16585 [Niastella sp.]